MNNDCRQWHLINLAPLRIPSLYRGHKKPPSLNSISCPCMDKPQSQRDTRKREEEEKGDLRMDGRANSRESSSRMPLLRSVSLHSLSVALYSSPSSEHRERASHEKRGESPRHGHKSTQCKSDLNEIKIKESNITGVACLV